MELLHLGLHRTGTTSLQKNLFCSSGLPYFGLHGDEDWLEQRKDWFRAFMGNSDPPISLNGDLIFSDESVLLRCGGISGVASLGERIARCFADPYVLVTVREPSALLVSAFYQSLRLRRVAVGFKDGSPIAKESMRFVTFVEWWAILERNWSRSLAGLLDYRLLRDQLILSLGMNRVKLLPLEYLAGGGSRYREELLGLGFEAAVVDRYMCSPAENTSNRKSLRHLRRSAFETGQLLRRFRLDGFCESAMRSLRLMRVIEWLMYSGKRDVAAAPDDATLRKIAARYAVSWSAVSGMPNPD